MTTGAIAAYGETVIHLFSSGVTDPSAAEVAKEHYGPINNRSLVTSVKKQLPAVRRYLVQQGMQYVYLVTDAYYREGFRKHPPETTADVLRCLPGGLGKSAGGLRLAREGDDPLWLAQQQRNVDSGAGKVRTALDGAIIASRDGKLSSAVVELLVDRARQRVLPTEEFTRATLTSGDEAA